MINKDELLDALKGLTSEQLAGILAQGHGRSPIKPRQLTDLRPLPTAQDPRPTFFGVDAPRDVLVTHSPFPRLMWHSETGQEITVFDEIEMQAKSPVYTATPPHFKPLDPVEKLRAEFEALSDDDKAFVLEMQRKARVDAVAGQMAGLSQAQIANALGSEPAKRGRAK